ncbi:MAG: hypothetical protein NVS3B7_02670 [Candidatus Elarobacter sp.]
MPDAAAAPALVRRGSGAKRGRTLILLLHGHGVDERDIFPLGDEFGADATVAALRAPIPSEGGYRWYAHHDVGRPTAESLRSGIAYVEGWLEANRGDANVVRAIGFSGGALMAGALALHAPQRYSAIAMLHGPLPFDAGLPLERDRLARCSVFYGYGEIDAVIPAHLVTRSCAYLRDESGADAVINGYRAGHSIPPAETRDLTRWYASLG